MIDAIADGRRNREKLEKPTPSSKYIINLMESEDHSSTISESEDQSSQIIDKTVLDSNNDSLEQTGVVYVSRIPPNMQPHKLRTMLSTFVSSSSRSTSQNTADPIGRVYLAREDDRKRQASIRSGGTRRKQFTEGWIEFKDKRLAKLLAVTLNNQPMSVTLPSKKSSSRSKGKSGSVGYAEDLWNLKYLPGFKWVHLTQQLAYERLARQKKMQVEMDLSKREIGAYLQNVDKSRMLQALEEKSKNKKNKKLSETEFSPIGNENKNQEEYEKQFTHIRQAKLRQRKAIDITEQSSMPSEKVGRVMQKLFQ